MFEYCGHAVVELGAQLVRLRRDDRERADPLAGPRFPILPYARERHDAAIGKRDRDGSVGDNMEAKQDFCSLWPN
jgi:hypothetical protein